MPRYLIKGEAGKTLGAGGYWLGDTLKAVNATLRYERLAPDRLEWTALTADLLAGETVVPDRGQMVELFYDTGGSQVRLFRGWTTSARPRPYGVAVTVENAWQYLRAEKASTVRTLNGSTDTRPSFELPEQPISTSIAGVVNRAIAQGVPMQWAGMPAAHSVQKLRYGNLTYEQLLTELLKWLPDATVAWDYQSSPTTHPILTIVRRGAMPTQTLALTNPEIVLADVADRPDLRPARVDLKYIERGTDGRPVFRSQAAGTAALGRVQTIVVSGPEEDTYLPKDNYASYTLQTANANTSLGTLRGFLLPLIPAVAASRLAYAGRPTSSVADMILANGETVTLQRATSGNLGTYTYPQPPLQFLDAETGEEVSRIGKHFVTGPVPPDWAAGVIPNGQRVVIRGRIYRLEETTLLTASGAGIEAPALPDWSVAFPYSQYVLLNGYYPSNTRSGYPWARVWLAALDFEVETILTTTSYAVPRTIYRPQDYDYNSPPAGLAAALLSAQDWTPYEGPIELQLEAPSNGGLSVASTYRLAGGRADLATMDAMARSVTHDLSRHRVRIELGAPSRLDIKSMAGRARSSAQTNITITP